MVVAYSVPPDAVDDALCPTCDWRQPPASDNLVDIGRCTVALERHLIDAHRVDVVTAERIAEKWALGRIRDKCR